MKNVSLSKKILAVVAAGSLVFAAGCSKEEAADNASSASSAASSVASEASTAASSAVQEAKATLADWDGAYRSLASYVGDPELDPELEKAAQEKGEDVAALKKQLEDKFSTEFGGLVIKDDLITFVKDAANLDNPSDTPVEYKYVESVDGEHDGHKFTWHVFQAQGDAQYKFVLLMKKHGEEELEHFHARFGDDKDALLAQDDFPTFVEPKSATKAQVAEELIEHLG